MATDSISSSTSKGIMGLGSSGSAQLSDELLNKLKNADAKAQIDPITKKLENNDSQQKELTALTSLISDLDSKFSSLTNETLYLKRKVNTTGTAATVTAVAGVSIQSMELDVKQLAKGDSYQTNKFKDSLSLIGAENEGTFKINIGRGVSYEINVKQSTSLQDIADQINEKARMDLQAKIVNVGYGQYQLVIQSADTGAESSFTFSDDKTGVLSKLFSEIEIVPDLDDDGNAIENEDGTPKTTINLDKHRLSTAQDAKFTYNGLEITRSKNTISDLRNGIDITLNEVGKSSSSIVQDTEDILKSVEEMVTSYNTFVKNINITTNYDEKSKQAGLFQGVNEVTTIRSTLNRILIGQNDEGKDIGQYGISMNKNGEFVFDQDVLKGKLSSDAEDVKKFFMGSTTYNKLTYTAKTPVVANGALKLEAGDFTLNGVSIKMTETKADATPKENALALMNAINASSVETGVYASLSKDETSIVLQTTDGTGIEIKGKDDILSSLGLSKTNMNASSSSVVGIFSKLETKIKELISKEEKGGKDGILTTYGKRLSNENEKMAKEKEKLETSLNQKYETMKERWSLYAAQITALENSFSALKTMIDYELNSKK